MYRMSHPLKSQSHRSCPVLPRQALRFLFQLGRQFDQRIPYDSIEDLTRQPFAFLCFGMKSSGRIGLGSIG